MAVVNPIRSCALVLASALLASACGGGSDSAELEALREKVEALEAQTTTVAPTTTVADFQGENLSGADLEGANLTGANLERAVADKYTIWPEGFDPVAAGVIFE